MAHASSDDYFQDSFDLDEDDLALLDETEAKFSSTVVQSTATPTRSLSISPPPAKHFRGWISPTDPSTPIVSPVVPTTTPLTAPPTVPPSVASTIVSESFNAPLEGNRSQRFNGTQDAENGVQKMMHDGNASDSALRQNRKPVVKTSSGYNLTRNIMIGVAPTRIVKPLQPTNRPSVPKPTTPAQTTQPLPQVVPTISNSPTPVATELETVDIKKELASLKAEFEKVNLQFVRAQEALKSAEVARYAKEGEVSILRKTLEKSNEQHAMALAKVREAKERADAEQARLQKEMKDQIERLRTEYVFKQHELEASVRKPTWSSKSKRASFGPYQSPVPLPPDMRDWSSGTQGGPSTWISQAQTPSRRRTSAEKGKTPKQFTGQRQAVPDFDFPGFDNSFANTSPVRSPSRRRTIPSIPETPSRSPLKGKGKMPVRSQERNNALFSPVKMASQVFSKSPRPVETVFQTDDNIQDFDIDMDVSVNRQRSSGKDPGRGSSPGHDVPDSSSAIGSEFFEEPEQEQMEIDDKFEGIDWRDELHFLLFTHTCEASKTISFHFLLSTSLESHFDYTEQYRSACSSVLETLGSKSKYGSLEKLMNSISVGLIRMACILWKIRYFTHLTALWDLIRSVIVYIPSLTPQVLLAVADFEDNRWFFMTIVSDIAKESLKLKDEGEEKGKIIKAFLHSTLSLVEAIAWTVPDTYSTNLALFLRTNGTIMSLLDHKQFTDVLSHSIRLLVVLATHSSLLHHFITAPDIDIFEQPLPSPQSDSTKMPLIEKLSSFLVDSSILSRDTVDRDLVAIMNFFALIGEGDPAGRTALQDSSTLVPAIIYRLFNLSSLLWEEDEQTVNDKDTAKRVISHMKYCLDLLHRLIFPDSVVLRESDELKTDYNLRYKLHTPPQAVFNGLAHMFTVMIGRLSYADSPDWLPSDLQTEIEKMTDPARDMMDLIIEGPESDSVWAAYQDAEVESITEEDEDVMDNHMLDEDELIE